MFSQGPPESVQSLLTKEQPAAPWKGIEFWDRLCLEPVSASLVSFPPDRSTVPCWDLLRCTQGSSVPKSEASQRKARGKVFKVVAIMSKIKNKFVIINGIINFDKLIFYFNFYCKILLTYSSILIILKCTIWLHLVQSQCQATIPSV